MTKEVEKLGIEIIIDANKPNKAVENILKAYDNSKKSYLWTWV